MAAPNCFELDLDPDHSAQSAQSPVDYGKFTLCESKITEID